MIDGTQLKEREYERRRKEKLCFFFKAEMITQPSDSFPSMIETLEGHSLLIPRVAKWFYQIGMSDQISTEPWDWVREIRQIVGRACLAYSSHEPLNTNVAILLFSIWCTTVRFDLYSFLIARRFRPLPIVSLPLTPGRKRVRNDLRIESAGQTAPCNA